MELNSLHKINSCPQCINHTLALSPLLPDSDGDDDSGHNSDSEEKERKPIHSLHKIHWRPRHINHTLALSPQLYDSGGDYGAT